MRQLIAVALFCAGLFCIAQAQVPMTGAGLGTPASGFTGSCSQSTNFIARTSGLSNTDKTNYDTMICGMVTDGTFSLLDGLYIFATNTTTTAKLNLIGTSGTITYHGTPSESSQFTAFNGYTGDGSTVFLDTGLVANALSNFTQNSASLGFYNLTSRTTAGGGDAMGASDGASSFSYMLVFNTGPVVQVDINSSGFTGPASGGANADGYWAGVRITSGGINIYNNGSSSTFGTISTGSFTPPADSFYILANNNNGTASSFSVYQLSAAFIGGLLTGTQSSNIATRLNTFMTAYGINKF